MTLSVLIPARNERYLAATVADLLAKAVGDLEIFPVLDGVACLEDPSHYPPLPLDPRVKPIYHQTPEGMRQSINHAAAQAQGDYLLKCDAHCQFAEGFDRVLLESIEPNWVVVPSRYSLDPKIWDRIELEGARHAHYLQFPYGHPGHDPVLRGWTWKERGAYRKDIPLDDEMTSQGSCWLMSRAQWERVGPLDWAGYGPFIQEFQEIGNKTWLGGGEVKINRATWYAHWYKREGQGYALSKRQSRDGIAFSLDQWFNDRWASPLKTRPFDWLIEKFWPVPGWPHDWRKWQKKDDHA